MLTAKVFQSGNSQALRIPKEAQTTQQEFYIRRLGDGYVLFPTNDPWFPLRHSLGTIPEDFMNEREQPSWGSVEKREEL